MARFGLVKTPHCGDKLAFKTDPFSDTTKPIDSAAEGSHLLLTASELNDDFIASKIISSSKMTELKLINLFLFKQPMLLVLQVFSAF